MLHLLCWRKNGFQNTVCVILYNSCSITNTDTKLRMQWAQLYVFYFSTFKVTTGLLLEELEVGCLTTSSISIRFWAKKSATFLFTAEASSHQTWIGLRKTFLVYSSNICKLNNLFHLQILLSAKKVCLLDLKFRPALKI